MLEHASVPRLDGGTLAAEGSSRLARRTSSELRLGQWQEFTGLAFSQQKGSLLQPTGVKPQQVAFPLFRRSARCQTRVHGVSRVR